MNSQCGRIFLWPIRR